jgi:hypothetical protein
MNAEYHCIPSGCSCHKAQDCYFILFWGSYLGDYVERWVPQEDVRFT